MILEKYRRQIDRLDAKIVQAIAERAKVVQGVAEFKLKNKMPVLQGKREQEKLQSLRILSKECGANPELIENIFKLVMKQSRAQQKELIASKRVIQKNVKFQ